MVNRTSKDISGQVFGTLTAIRPTDNRKNGSVVWLCQCACSKYQMLGVDKLRTRGNQCNCPVRVDDTYNQLTVIEELDKDKWKNRKWLCECTCGNKTEIRQPDLKSGHIKSCGCLQGIVSTKHGMYLSAEYKAWDNMKQRCSNPNHPHWDDYGGRGVSVCERWWFSFINFYEDMGDRPIVEDTNMSLDRVDVDGNYEKSNCRWTTDVVQANNKRKRFIR